MIEKGEVLSIREQLHALGILPGDGKGELPSQLSIFGIEEKQGNGIVSRR